MASSNSSDMVNQLESGSIHSSDIGEAQIQGDKPTGELRSRKKRKIKVRLLVKLSKFKFQI